MNRWDIINHLIEKNGYQSYLEIGYFKGWSFDNVKCKEKTAVDPSPSKTPEQEGWLHGTIAEISEGEGILKMTSDEFFRIKDITGQHFGEGDKDTWDIIFIDGLHEANQVLRDIENSLKHLSENGIIVVHDCNPPTLEHTTTGDAGGNWNGDVYKAIITLRQVQDKLDIYTVDTDWGVGIIRPLPGLESCRHEITIKDDSFWWPKMERRKELLNLISVEEFLKREAYGQHVETNS